MTASAVTAVLSLEGVLVKVSLSAFAAAAFTCFFSVN